MRPWWEWIVFFAVFFGVNSLIDKWRNSDRHG